MGTTTDKQGPTTTMERVVTRLGNIQTEATETAYGRRGASGWAYVLIIVIGLALLLDGTMATVAGGIALIALAVWVGGRR